MDKGQSIVVELSKKKLLLLFLASVVFIVASGWLFVVDVSEDSSYAMWEPFLPIVGIVGVAFGMLGAAFTLKKLFDKRPGLILDELGIIDNSSYVSVGLIPWSDIEEVSSAEVADQKFVMIFLRNPEDYINQQQSAFAKRLMKVNNNTYGTPIMISANSLKMKFPELLELISKQYAIYQLG